jgi:hypothetical protein
MHWDVVQGEEVEWGIIRLIRGKNCVSVHCAMNVCAIQLHMLNPTLWKDTFLYGDARREGHKSKVFTNVASALTKVTPDISLTPFTMGGHNGKIFIYGPRRVLSPESEHTDTLSLYLETPEPWEINVYHLEASNL